MSTRLVSMWIMKVWHGVNKAGVHVNENQRRLGHPILS